MDNKHMLWERFQEIRGNRLWEEDNPEHYSNYGSPHSYYSLPSRSDDDEEHDRKKKKRRTIKRILAGAALTAAAAGTYAAHKHAKSRGVKTFGKEHRELLKAASKTLLRTGSAKAAKEVLKKMPVVPATAPGKERPPKPGKVKPHVPPPHVPPEHTKSGTSLGKETPPNVTIGKATPSSRSLGGVKPPSNKLPKKHRGGKSGVPHAQ